MTYETFDATALAAIDRAAREARESGARVVGLPHLLIALSERGRAARALDGAGVDRAALVGKLRDRLAPGHGAFSGVPEPSARLQRLLRAAHEEGLTSGRPVDDLALLRAACREADGSAAAALRDMGLDGPDLALHLAAVQAAADKAPAAAGPRVVADEAPAARLRAVAREGRPRAQAAGASATPMLDELGRDLTALARAGKLSPVFGRDEEVRRVTRTLLRRTKSNPVLLGDAGVGKTAIVEALAQRIADGNVREDLRGLRIVEIPVSALVAGTKYRGEFEERLRGLLAEVTRDPGIVLFVDELHTLLGAGSAEGHPLDAANMLKPPLARGEIRCIGATTLDEYRRHVESDAALARRFQPLVIDEPSPGAALTILRQLAPRFGKHHGLTIDDDALEAAVRLSVAHLPDRRLPDKAIDLLDEACARVRLRTLRPAAQEQFAVTSEDVAAALADWTGIAVGLILADEREQLRTLEALLAERVVGQEEAVQSVARVLRLGRTGLKDPRRPVGVLLFLGPTGVGKTEMARAVAEVLYGDTERLIRLDMSEYGEPHMVSRLIGAPPGYVGHEEPGQLSEALRRHPQSVVLLDEIEKAHRRALDLFLQLFDAGRLTDAHGRTVDGRQALFILTSNLGTSVEPVRPIGLVKGPPQVRMPPNLVETLSEALRPEFINRLDAIVPFQFLDLPELERIAQRFLAELQERAAAQHTILEVDPAAVSTLAVAGLDPWFGARPLRRAIERLVAEPLAQLLLRERPPRRVRVGVDAAGAITVTPWPGSVS